MERSEHNEKRVFLVFVSKQMDSKLPHRAKAFGTGIPSMDIDGKFRKFKGACEKYDSEIRESENQRKLENEKKMRPIIVTRNGKIVWKHGPK